MLTASEVCSKNIEHEYYQIVKIVNRLGRKNAPTDGNGVAASGDRNPLVDKTGM
jgi:hypothetical protein